MTGVQTCALPIETLQLATARRWVEANLAASPDAVEFGRSARERVKAALIVTALSPDFVIQQ